jgi:peptide/nickel transport system substrate-binding protein
MDEDTRKALVQECLAAFDDTLPQVVLYASTEIITHTDRLQNFIPNPTNMTNFCISAPWKLA